MSFVFVHCEWIHTTHFLKSMWFPGHCGNAFDYRVSVNSIDGYLIQVTMTLPNECLIVPANNGRYISGLRLPELHYLIKGCFELRVRPFFSDNKVHGANMGPTWVLSAPDGPHFGLMNLDIRVVISEVVLLTFAVDRGRQWPCILWRTHLTNIHTRLWNHFRDII